MKPKLWIAKTDFASLSDENDGCDALHQCATVSRDGCKILPDDVPLFTADQLAEAVAAERERNIGACNKVEEGYVRARMGDCATASHRCAQAIRSAAK